MNRVLEFCSGYLIGQHLVLNHVQELLHEYGGRHLTDTFTVEYFPFLCSSFLALPIYEGSAYRTLNVFIT